MRSRFRLHATCALEERKIEVVRVFPIYYMQIVPQIVIYKLFPPHILFFVQPHTLAGYLTL